MREQCGIAFQNGTLARTGNIDLRAGKSGPQHPSVLYKHKYPRSQGKVLAPIALAASCSTGWHCAHAGVPLLSLGYVSLLCLLRPFETPELTHHDIFVTVYVLNARCIHLKPEWSNIQESIAFGLVNGNVPLLRMASNSE